eukprot:COSAG02_NODE_46025_length_352_cov_0.818182_1_plen_49_part_10
MTPLCACAFTNNALSGYIDSYRYAYPAILTARSMRVHPLARPWPQSAES